MRFLLILIIINISIVNETVAQVPTISNISLGPPILCNGDFTNILVDVNQTIPATAYTCVTGYYSGTYFISFATTNTTTSNSFSFTINPPIMGWNFWLTKSINSEGNASYAFFTEDPS